MSGMRGLPVVQFTAAKTRRMGERSDTHQFQFAERDGFREELNPSYTLIGVADNPHRVIQASSQTERTRA
jgi:hypothetical protein